MQDCYQLINILAFEQWLRFEWLDESDTIRVDTLSCKKIEEHFPELVPLLNALNGLTIEDGSASRQAVLSVAEHQLGRKKLADTLDDEHFKSEVRRFQGWVQDEAENPTCDSSDFAVWLKAFVDAGQK